MKTPLFQRSLLFGLAILVLLNSFGIFAFTIAGAEIHRAFESEEKNTSSLVMSESDFASLAWIGSHDFIYDNKVYDCDSVVHANGKVTIGCHTDNEETCLRNNLADNFDSGSKNPLGAKPIKDIFKIFPVYTPETALQIPVAGTNGATLSSFISSQPLQSADIRLNSPPPELA